jgi:hypothetical protein
MVKGREDPSGPTLLGSYIQTEPNGQHRLLRGKYATCLLDDVPRGYVRNYILKVWAPDMSEEERELFQYYGHRGLDENENSEPTNQSDTHTTR